MAYTAVTTLRVVQIPYMLAGDLTASPEAESFKTAVKDVVSKAANRLHSTSS